MSALGLFLLGGAIGIAAGSAATLAAVLICAILQTPPPIEPTRGI